MDQTINSRRSRKLRNWFTPWKRPAAIRNSQCCPDAIITFLMFMIDPSFTNGYPNKGGNILLRKSFGSDAFIYAKRARPLS